MASEEDGCESFVYPIDFDWNEKHGYSPGFGFCKTGRCPYDEVVAASLLALKHHLGEDVETASDGEPEEEEWQRALQLFATTFPHRNLRALVPWGGALKI